MRSLPHIQERRAHHATLLAAAISAISASLDVDVALEKIAEQTAHLLRLESASVCLFGESNEIGLLHTCSSQHVSRSKFL